MFTDLVCFQNEKIRERLKESQQRIKELEEKLAETRDAHAREREARQSLENEREKMNVFLERMGEGLRSLAVHPQSNTGGETMNTAQSEEAPHSLSILPSVSTLVYFIFWRDKERFSYLIDLITM